MNNFDMSDFQIKVPEVHLPEMPDEYSCAVKPPFRNAGYRRSGNGVPQLLLAN